MIYQDPLACPPCRGAAAARRRVAGGRGVEVNRVGTVDGYRVWSATYDQPGNPAFDMDTPVVDEIVDGLPVGVALWHRTARPHAGRPGASGHRGGQFARDARPCAGTGARGKFLPDDLCALPIPDAEVDLVVCALALFHGPGDRGVRQGAATRRAPGHHRHAPPRPCCVVPFRPCVTRMGGPASGHLPPARRGLPARAAIADVPAMVIWHFQRAGQRSGESLREHAVGVVVTTPGAGDVSSPATVSAGRRVLPGGQAHPRR